MHFQKPRFPFHRAISWAVLLDESMGVSKVLPFPGGVPSPLPPHSRPPPPPPSASPRQQQHEPATQPTHNPHNKQPQPLAISPRTVSVRSTLHPMKIQLSDKYHTFSLTQEQYPLSPPSHSTYTLQASHSPPSSTSPSREAGPRTIPAGRTRSSRCSASAALWGPRRRSPSTRRPWPPICPARISKRFSHSST